MLGLPESGPPPVRVNPVEDPRYGISEGNREAANEMGQGIPVNLRLSFLRLLKELRRPLAREVAKAASRSRYVRDWLEATARDCAVETQYLIADFLRPTSTEEVPDAPVRCSLCSCKFFSGRIEPSLDDDECFIHGLLNIFKRILR